MKRSVTIVLVGIGGYGSTYLSALLDYQGTQKFQIVGVVDPNHKKCSLPAKLHKADIPIFDTLEDFYKRNHCDLAIICSPIHYHCPQTCLALSKGSYVLCEKPMCANIEQAKEMIKSSKQAGKWVAIGYQWSYSTAIQQLKHDIKKGLFGKPKRLKSLVLWPRGEEYYQRNDWAGKIHDSRGNWVLDSPINNATAHYLHNMFYILGRQINGSSYIVDVVAELYRANEIENFDTAALRTYTDTGTEILFYSSHAVKSEIGPIFSYEFENAVVSNVINEKVVSAYFKDGTIKEYENLELDSNKKLWAAIDAVENNKQIVCGLAAAVSQTICVDAARQSMPNIVDFPKDIIQIEGKIGTRKRWVVGLANSLLQCYQENLLPGEMSIPWAKKGKHIDLKNLDLFDRPGNLLKVV